MYLQLCNEEARRHPIILDEASVPAADAQAASALGPMPGVATEATLTPSEGLQEEQESVTTAIPQTVPEKQQTSISAYSPVKLEARLQPAATEDLAPVLSLLNFLFKERQLYTLHDALEKQMRALSEGRLDGDSALRWVEAQVVPRFPEAMRRAQKLATRDATRKSTSRETGKRPLQKRLSTVSVPSNGNCVIVSCLAHKQQVERPGSIDMSTVPSIRQSVGANQAGYLDHEVVSKVLAHFDIGAVVIRENESVDGYYYFLRRPKARLFAVVEESSCAGGNHWKPVKLGNACGLLPMAEVQAELVRLNIPKRGYPENVMKDGVILVF